MELVNEYRLKVKMNLETEYLTNFLGFARYSFFILTGAVKDKVNVNSEEWKGFVSQIKLN